MLDPAGTDARRDDDRPALSLRVAQALCAHRWMAFGSSLLFALVCVVGILRLDLGHGYRQFIDPDDEALAVADAISAELAGGRDILTLIYRPASAQVFESTSMLQLAKLADLVSRLEHVASPQSLVSAHKLVRLTDTYADAQSAAAYRVVPLIYPDGLFDDDGLARLRKDVAAMPTVQGRLVARDASSAAVVVPIDLGATSRERVERLATLRADVLRLEADLRGLRDGDRLVLAGPALFEFAVEEIMVRDLKVLAPVSVLVFLVLLLFLFRSVASAGIILVVVLLSCAATLGLVSWAGMRATILVFSGLILVSTLSIAEALHVMTTATQARLAGASAVEATVHSLDVNLWAIVTTTTTTAIGQAVLLFSASPAIRNMGVVMMVGSALALLFTLTIVPALISRQVRVRRGWVNGMGGAIDRLATFCTNRPAQVLAVAGLVGLLVLPGLLNLRSFDTMAGWFARSTEFRQGLDLLGENYAVLGAVDVLTRVQAADREAIAAWPQSRPELAAQFAFDQQLAGISSLRGAITPSSALAGFQARSTQSDTGLALSSEVSDEAPRGSALGLAALEKAHLMTPSDGGRDVWLSRALDAGLLDNGQMLKVAQGAVAAAAQLPERETLVGGLPVVFAKLGHDNMDRTLPGTVLTVLAISACMAVALRSLRLAALSLLPNVLPVALVFGFWGLMSGEINLAAMTVLSVALGVVVDDTTHIMMKHRRYMLTGHSPTDACRLTIVHVGPAIIVTTVILTCGFLILGYSDFALTSQQSLMVAASIAVAVVFDLTVTPVLLSLVAARRSA